jgi:hypothetical protein
MATFMGSPGRIYQTRGGTYTADGNGMIYGVPATGWDQGDLVDDGATPVIAVPTANFRNLLDGGDFSINPFQRNIPGLASANVIATAISNTATYFADRWFAVAGASSAVLVANQASTTVAGFNRALRLTRQAANTDTTQITFGQVLETADCIRLQGQTFRLDTYATLDGEIVAADADSGIAVMRERGPDEIASDGSLASPRAGDNIGRALVAAGPGHDAHGEGAARVVGVARRPKADGDSSAPPSHRRRRKWASSSRNIALPSVQSTELDEAARMIQRPAETHAHVDGELRDVLAAVIRRASGRAQRPIARRRGCAGSSLRIADDARHGRRGIDGRGTYRPHPSRQQDGNLATRSTLSPGSRSCPIPAA